MNKLVNSNAIYVFFLLLIALFIFSGCQNSESVEACLEGYKYGFLGGLWHGIIAPVDFIISLFRDDFTVYAQNNNGAWYAFGFILGSGGWGILGGKGIRKRRKRREDY